MSDLSKLARPYAKAAFDLARADSALAQWAQMLETTTAMVVNSKVRDLISNPNVAQSRVAKMLVVTGGDNFSAKFTNFLRLLAENKRLLLVPEIAAMYKRLRQAEEKQLEVQVVSAVELSADQQERMSTALARRFDREIELQTTVDPDLIGGAVIHAGDTVIDGSLRGELNKLAVQLADG